MRLLRALDASKNYLVVCVIFSVGLLLLIHGTYSPIDETSQQIRLIQQELDTLKDVLKVADTGPRPSSYQLTLAPAFKTRDLVTGLKYPRVLCWVMTDPKVLNKTRNARDTWTKRCDKSIFMSSARDDEFPTVGLNVTAGRNHIASKCRAAWIHIYEHHINEFDYFVKADPDTFLVVENMKEYLSHFDPETPQYFGHRYTMSWGIYMAGGPGVILSRSAVRLLVTKALSNKKISQKCMPDGQGEDWKICKCLKIAGAKPVDTLDERGRERFFVLSISSVFHGHFPPWYRDRDRSKRGKECCSDYPIGFHYVGKDNFLVLEYFLYHTKLKYKEEEKLLWH